MKKKYGYLVDPEGQTTGRVELPTSLKGYYSLLDCNTIDIVSRQVGGVRYDVICDDEGLFKDMMRVSAIGSQGIMFVGKILFCRHDGQGNETGLTGQDFGKLISHTHYERFMTGVEY